MHDSLRVAGQFCAILLIGFVSNNLHAQSGAIDSSDAIPATAASEPMSPADIEHVNYAYAQVLNVSPVFQDIRVAHQVEQCDDYERIERKPPRGTGGTVLGAIIGGALGNQVGSGSGRAAATVAGAVVGGALGREVGTETDASTETRCHLVEEFTFEPQVVGYDVEYRYRGEVFVSRLEHNPGDRLRIRVAVSPAETGGQDEAQAPSQAASYY